MVSPPPGGEAWALLIIDCTFFFNANARWLAPGRGGGGGAWALLELTDALLQNMSNCLQVFEGEPRKDGGFCLTCGDGICNSRLSHKTCNSATFSFFTALL